VTSNKRADECQVLKHQKAVPKTAGQQLVNPVLKTGVPKRGITGFKPQKLDLTTDAEYVANLVNANMWL